MKFLTCGRRDPIRNFCTCIAFHVVINRSIICNNTFIFVEYEAMDMENRMKLWCWWFRWSVMAVCIMGMLSMHIEAGYAQSTTGTQPLGGETPLTVYVDGRLVEASAVAIEATAYVELDSLARMIESVSYEEDNGIVTVTIGTTTYTFRSGERDILLNGVKRSVAEVAWERGSLTDQRILRYMPVRWLTFLDCCKVVLDPIKKAILVYRLMRGSDRKTPGVSPITSEVPSRSDTSSVEPIGSIVFDPALPRTKDVTVMIDAGHGGQDTGAISVRGRYEKDLNLRVAQMVYTILSVDGTVTPRLMRATDQFIAPLERVRIANEMRVDLFVSIHANMAPSPLVQGVESFYWREDSLFFATALHKAVLDAVGTNDRGVRKQRFAVVRATTMPAVLLELGFLSNASEEAKLHDEVTQRRIAEGIAGAIIAYARQKP